MKHSRREDVWTNRGNLNICTKEKILRNQVTIGKLRVLRAITQHSLGKCPAAPIVLGPRNCVNRAAPLGLLRLEGGEQQGGQLVGQSNRLHGVPSLSISSTPGGSQPYMHSWQHKWNDIRTPVREPCLSPQ